METPNSTNNSNKYLVIGILMLLLVVALFATLFAILLTNQDNDSDQNPNVTIVPTTQPTSTTSMKTNELIFPFEGSEVAGEIEFSGSTSSSLETLVIEVEDQKQNKLVTAEFTLEGDDSDAAVSWITKVNLERSPEALTGKIYVYPKAEGRTSEYAVMRAISFTQLTLTDRLKVNAPQSEQIFTGGELLVKGEMKGFFEAVMNVRLVDNSGNALFEDIIMPDSDQYENFASFSENFTITLPASLSGVTGEFEFYEISAQDGSETVLLSVPINFE